MDSFNDVFQEVLKYCRNCKSISEPGYNKWIKILEPMKLENNVAYLLTDSDFSRDITMNAYENLLKEAFLNTLGFEVDIKILVKDKEEVNETEEKDIEVKVADFSDEENNNLTFDNFISETEIVKNKRFFITAGCDIIRVYNRVQLVAGRRCDFLHTDLSE